MLERRAVPLSVVWFALLLLGASMWALAISLAEFPPGLSLQLTLLIAAILLSENFALEVSPFSSVSMSLPLTMAAVLLTGPGGGGLAALACCSNLRELRERRAPALTVFNLGQIVLSACVGGLAYSRLGGSFMSAPGGLHPLAGSALPRSLLAWVFAAAIASVLNLTLVGLGTAFMRRVAVLEVARSALSLLPSQFALAFVAFFIAQVLSVSPVAFPLFLFPLFLARQLYQRYARLRDDYLDTVRSLVSALEAKDPYTRGHSERVAKYACALGASCGFDERRLDTLRQAALLHDVGKLALSARVISKPDRLTDDEFSVVRKHPAAGAQMVSRIPALRSLAGFVQYHHERVDGKGYPDGLIGEQIPELSRVLAVADAYDAMTSTRPYRAAMSHDEAVVELLRGQGSQFDPVLVRHFVDCAVASSRGGRCRIEHGAIAAEPCQ